MDAFSLKVKPHLFIWKMWAGITQSIKSPGWMFLRGETGADKFFYTTGRLTSEMVIKTVQMNIPILISRSGFTESGVDLARQAGLTLIGRARGKRFTVLSGAERILFDNDAVSEDNVSEEDDHYLSPQRQQTNAGKKRLRWFQSGTIS